MAKTLLYALGVGFAFGSSTAFPQTLECSSPHLIQDLQLSLQQRFAPPAINSIEAIARGQSTPATRVEITSIETLSQDRNIQRCSASARVWRTDLGQPINATVQYTIYNRSMMGGFDVIEPR